MVFVLVYAMIGQSCSEVGDSKQDEKILAENDYVGAETCKGCHTEAFNDWKHSHHDLAMMPASDESVLGNFDDSEFIHKGVHSKFYKKNNEFFVNTESEDGSLKEYKVAYTFGVEPLQQYLIEFPDGKYQAMDIAWDTEEGKWFHLHPDLTIAPNEWLHWSAGALNWNSMCADCHSTNLEKNFNSTEETYHTSWSIINVSCEACHGQAKTHVELAQSGNYDSKNSGLLQTSEISSIEQVSQCAPCHARRSSISTAGVKTGDFLDHYIPELIRTGSYHPDGQILDEVYVYGSFLQSKMYHKGVKCTDCHNPHSLSLKMVGNDLCVQCHEPEKFDVEMHHFHKKDSEGSQCVNCHMPGKFYMVNDFRHDHSFRIPRPDQTVKYGVPNSCNQCHAEKSADWASGAIDQWYGKDRKTHFSNALTAANADEEGAEKLIIDLINDTSQAVMGRASGIPFLLRYNSSEAISTLLNCFKSEHSLIRFAAINGITEFPEEERILLATPLLKDPVRAVRMTAAYALSNVNPQRLSNDVYSLVVAGMAEYQTYLRGNQDMRAGQFSLGVYHERQGNLPAAETAYLKTLEQDSLFNMARMNLAVMYNKSGENKKAMDALEMVIKLEPEYGESYYSMGLLLAEEGELEKAEKYMHLAAEKIESNPRVFYNLGLILQTREKRVEAEKYYKKGLKIDPNSDYLHHALAVLYLQNQSLEKARKHVLILNQMFPESQEYQEWKQMLQSN